MRVLLLTFMLLTALLGTYAKKTNKEWAEFNKQKLNKLEAEEYNEMDKTLGPDSQVEKPGMIFVTFRSNMSRREKEELSRMWQAQLMTGGTKTSMFPTEETDWLLTTHRTSDNHDVLKYLIGFDDLMKVSVDNREHWNLPRYQKEYDIAWAENEKKKKTGSMVPRKEDKADRQEL